MKIMNFSCSLLWLNAWGRILGFALRLTEENKAEVTEKEEKDYERSKNWNTISGSYHVSCWCRRKLRCLE
jgi:hypothetical protein